MGVNVVVGQFKAQDLGLRVIWLIRPPALPHYHYLGELSYPSQASLSKVAANKGQKQLSCYHSLSAVVQDGDLCPRYTARVCTNIV